MLRHAIIVLLACTCLAASACGGGAPLRDLSKQPAPECRIESDTDQCGCPAVVRCVIAGDPDFDLLRYSFTWDISNGTITDHNENFSVVWVAITKPGACQMSARGVDKDGKDCTTPRHKISCARGLNSPPIPLPNGPLDGGYGEMSDNDGTAPYRYHEWRWDNGLSYDPEGSSFDTEWLITGDWNGDGVDEIFVERLGDGSVRVADLDGDGKSDFMVMQTKPTEFVVRTLFRTIKSKEDVYVWKMAIKEQGLPAKKKEFKGHVTLLK